MARPRPSPREQAQAIAASRSPYELAAIDRCLLEARIELERNRDVRGMDQLDALREQIRFRRMEVR